MITVDFAQPIGRIRELHGANFGPLLMNGAIDLSAYHRRIKFPTIRLHDCLYSSCNAVDIPSIFPLFHLDAQDPHNYLFPKTDGYLQSILDCGERIIYRLGVSIQCHHDYHFDTDPPSDYEKWADICINIIRHYNEGWANGFHHDTQYWEIWNEPENGGPGMWNASYEEYVRFYLCVAQRIKAACPTIKIGGPALNGEALNTPRLLHTFLPAVREAGAPLDFCTWHAYPERPMQLVTAAQQVRDVLDQYGFQHTESHLNEWNLAPFKGAWGPHCNELQGLADWIDRKKGPEGGAMAASCLIALQDAPVDMTNYYDASNNPFGMFEASGLPAKPYYAFLAFREMLDHAPVRCHVTGSEPDSGLAVLAGASDDGGEYRLMISNVESIPPSPGTPFTIAGLPEHSVWQVEQRKLDGHCNLETVDTFRLDPVTHQLTLLVQPRSMQLLSLRRVD